MCIENEIESFIKNILTNSCKELKGMINIINKNKVIERYRSGESKKEFWWLLNFVIFIDI